MQANNKRFRLTFSVLSLGYIVLGLLQLLVPKTSANLICITLGIVAIVYGIVRVAFFVMRKDQSRIFQNDLAVGVVLLIAGVFIIARKDMVLSWIPILLGFAIVFDSIIKLQYALELRRKSYEYWAVGLVASLVTTVLAVLLILGLFSGDFLHYYLGIVVLLDGVLNLAMVALLMLRIRSEDKQEKQADKKKRKKAKPEPEEKYEDEEEEDGEE